MHLCSSYYRALWIFIHSLRHQMHSGYAARLSLILFIMGSQCLCVCVFFWEHVIVPSALAYKITSPPSHCHYSIMWNVKSGGLDEAILLFWPIIQHLCFFSSSSPCDGSEIEKRQHSRWVEWPPPTHTHTSRSHFSSTLCLKSYKLRSCDRWFFFFFLRFIL